MDPLTRWGGLTHQSAHSTRPHTSPPGAHNRVLISEAELALDGFDLLADRRVGVEERADLADGGHDRGVVLPAEAIAELREAGAEPLPAEVHGHHAREADRPVPPVRL